MIIKYETYLEYARQGSPKTSINYIIGLRAGFAAFMLTAHIVLHSPERESINKLSEDLTDFTKKLSSL